MLFGFTALKDFFLFMLGVFGLPFFCMVHKMLVKCDSKVFSYICIVLTYLLFTFIQYK